MHAAVSLLKDTYHKYTYSRIIYSRSQILTVDTEIFLSMD